MRPRRLVVVLAIFGWACTTFSVAWRLIVEHTLVVAEAAGWLFWTVFFIWLLVEVWKSREPHDLRRTRKAFERAWKDGDAPRRITVLRDDGPIEPAVHPLGREGGAGGPDGH